MCESQADDEFSSGCTDGLHPREGMFQEASKAGYRRWKLTGREQAWPPRDNNDGFRGKGERVSQKTIVDSHAPSLIEIEPFNVLH